MDSQRVPIGKEIFFQRGNFDEAWQKLEDKTVLVIAGPSGCGKSELALQLQKTYKNQDRRSFYGALIPCDSKETLRGELLEFVQHVQLNVDANVLARGQLDDIFDEVFEQMNNCFVNKTKFLIFDDAELESDVLYYIDQALLSVLDKKPVEDPLRKSWKIVLTTQVGAPLGWLEKCDFVNPDSFLSVDGLYEEEVPQLLKQSKRGNQFTTEDVALMKENFGTRPLMLNAVKNLADKDTAKSPSEVLRNFLADIGRLGQENKDVSGLFVSIERVVKNSSHAEEFKEFIMVLTMFHETNIPEELLISCAEVIISSSGVDGVEEVGKRAKTLRINFIHDMTERSLFEEPRKYGNTTLLSFHKLLKQAMKQYSVIKVDHLRDRQIAQKALLALTRVMPRDGRGHKSHLYLFFYRHAQTLLKEVEKLTHYEDLVSRTETPLLLLLMCILNVSMGYCLHSMKYPVQDALKHVDEALTIYSRLFVDQEYDQLMAPNPDVPEPIQKAKILFEKCYDKQLPAEITQWLEKLPSYLLLTDRDKQILLPDEPKGDPLNGHLDDAQMQKVRQHKSVLQPDVLAKFYAVEVLADVYFMAVKICNDGEYNIQVMGYYSAAILLYWKIRLQSDVMLLAEIVLEREMQNVVLKSDEVAAVILDKMVIQWAELRSTDKKAFECGLMRADFRDDPYNDFLCNEGIIRCKGRKCAIEYDEATFHEINKRFQEHLEQAEKQKDDPKLQSNNQTVSKAYRYYGEFLLQCGHAREAVRAIIDSLYYLSQFLKQKAKQTPFRELDITCGKAKPLWKLLEKAYLEYAAGHGEGPLLEQDGTDDLRVCYVRDTLSHWRSQCGSEDERFSVLEKILEASGIVVEGSCSDNTVLTAQPATDPQQ